MRLHLTQSSKGAVDITVTDAEGNAVGFPLSSAAAVQIGAVLLLCPAASPKRNPLAHQLLMAMVKNIAGAKP